jgi:tRNA threonylcarbamoyl adenosine modification protein YeaZ
MKIIAIDTSVGISVAVLDDEKVLAETTKNVHGIQGEQTAAIIQELLNEAGLTVADLTDVVVGVGPGPYTGLRVGIATAQALAFARGLSVTGICSLDAVAYDFGKPCVVITDARRKELYWAKYETVRVQGPQVNTADQIAHENEDVEFVGPGVGLYPDSISGTYLPLRAASLGLLVASGKAQPVPVLPMYLRKPDAQEPTIRKSVL